MTEPEAVFKPIALRFFVVVLFALAAAGFLVTQVPALVVWLMELLLFLSFLIMAGFNQKGVVRGFLIDERNKLSLSRLQLIAWTVLILSAFFTAVAVNLFSGAHDAMAIVIPGQLWVLMGISTTSLVGSPLLLNQKAQKDAKSGELDRLNQRLAGRARAK